MNKKVLILKNMSCGYASRPVLKDINLEIAQGEAVLLAGPNGCGKSTMLKAIAGILPLKKGTIHFDGIELGNVATEKRIRSGIGYLRQTNNIFPGLTVRENLELAGFSLSSAEFRSAEERIFSIFDLLKNVQHRRSGELSGGQRQALAIAMVFMCPKSLYLLDEPTAGLSPAVAADIMERVGSICNAGGKQTVLMVEHRLELIQWVERAIILIQGKVQAEIDDTQLLLNSEWLAKHYF